MNGTKWMVRWAWAGMAGGAIWGMLGGAAFGQPPKKPVSAPAPAVIPPNKTVATVNGEAITFAQLEPLLKQTDPLPANMPEAQRRELYREALSILIDDMLVAQFLRKYVPPVPAGQVDKKMTTLLAELKAQKKTLVELCKESGQTEAEMRATLAQGLQWAAYADKNISEANLRKYYTEYKDFFDKVMVRASHIVLRLGNGGSEKDRAEAKAKAKAKLQEIRAQILAGKLDFAVAAKTYSQCPSAATGGDIGSFPRKFVVDESFARVAFSMKTGEISDVVQSDSGLHLIKVTERKPGQPSDFTKIKEEVCEFYLEDLKQNILAQLRKDAKIAILLP